jgi:hypothetical protein
MRFIGPEDGCPEENLQHNRATQIFGTYNRPLRQRGLAASLGVDHGKIFAALEDEVRGQLRYLSEKPLENVDREGRVVPQWGPKLSDP